MKWKLGITACCWSSCALLAQAELQMQGGRMHATVVSEVGQSGKRSVTPLAAGKRVTVASGPVLAHFASNANGKPLSLPFVAAGQVNIGIDAAASATSQALQPFAVGGSDDALVTKLYELPTQLRTIGSGEEVMRDYRISATVEVGSDTKMVGLVTRHNNKHGCYLFTLDLAAHKLRLERCMGGHHMVIRELAAPWLLAKHTLSMQVEGFRLQCAVDDEVVLQSFDGALGGGDPGVAWVGERPSIGSVMLEPVRAPLASAVLIQEGNHAHLHAAVGVAPGHLFVLELVLDRPHPWVPRSVQGLEPSLMQPAAAPIVAWGDWRNSLGSNTIGEISVDSTCSSELLLPDLPALRLHCALAHFLLVTPDGEAVVGVTPNVRLTF
jgi:hypothetical protein